MRATDTDILNGTARPAGQPRAEGSECFCGEHQEDSTELEVYNKACFRHM